MEKLKHYSEILTLGRLLVKEIGLEKSVDTLGRWMAHSISELIVEAEKSDGSDKANIEERCREAILALWKHIRVFPDGQRPLVNIEPLLVTIKALNPENQAYFYQREVQSEIEESTLSDEAKNWLELSREIDYSARLLIGMCLKNVASEVAEEKRDLLELAKSLDADTPITTIIRFLTDEQKKSDKEQEAEVIREAIRTLKIRRERLKKMIELSELLISSIDGDISNMESSIK